MTLFRDRARLGAAAICLLAATSAMAQTKPSKPEKPEKAGPPPALTAALTELTAEFEKALKDPAATVRDKSDYFGTDPKGIDAPTLLAALSKRMNKDPRVDAYVKWQLLSAHPAPFEESQTKAVLALYRNAPRPPARLGSTPQEQNQLNSQTSRLKKEQAPEFDAEWQKELDKQMRTAGTPLRYRDELFSRLPKTPDVFQAALNDADERMQLGYVITPWLNVLAGDIRSWAAGAKPNEVRGMVKLIGNYSGKTGPKWYSAVAWDDKKRSVQWTIATPAFDKKVCDQLMTDLVQMTKGG